MVGRPLPLGCGGPRARPRFRQVSSIVRRGLTKPRGGRPTTRDPGQDLQSLPYCLGCAHGGLLPVIVDVDPSGVSRSGRSLAGVLARRPPRRRSRPHPSLGVVVAFGSSSVVRQIRRFTLTDLPSSLPGLDDLLRLPPPVCNVACLSLPVSRHFAPCGWGDHLGDPNQGQNGEPYLA